jgi:hypothetical protein
MEIGKCLIEQEISCKQDGYEAAIQDEEASGCFIISWQHTIEAATARS